MRDTAESYGLVSRFLHWLMALLLFWQFAGALLYVGIGDTAVTRFVGGRHLELGAVLFVLVILRAGWALINRERRPIRHGLADRAAGFGHALLYGLMLFIPAIALLRQFGSGKPFSVFGLRVMPGRSERIAWLEAPADLLHYWLGFALLALALGHASFALAHRASGKRHLLRRML
ncbi:cytochrome b/b6 domain-containing protein [Bosea sp. Leaf344]|uniref:cytochrome b n=1 Tax=Bosea sp. Leaf344 TaxID=1736346 RepID=UPI000A6E1BA4|nr:cytochrome b/b6 domain-containing protein [Bosea sp. Leaf344]